MRACPALAFEVPARDMLVLRNGFNDETFIFPNRLDDPHAICNDVVLGEGGSVGGHGPEHVHPLADETFFVRSGRLKVVVHGQSHFVNPRESLRIRRGAPHYFTNAHDGDTEFSVVFDPPQQHRRFLANFAATTERHAGWFTKHGKPNALLTALVLHRYRGHLYLASHPIWLQKLVFGMLAPLARLLGYGLVIEPER